MKGISKISVTEDVALVTFNNIPRDLRITSDILKSFSEKNINIDMISQSAPIGAQADVSFTVSSDQVIKTLGIVNLFREDHPIIRPMVNDGNCKIQLFGEEMRETPGVAAEVFSVVSKHSSEIMLITTSEIDISILVARHDMHEILSALKATFQV